MAEKELMPLFVDSENKIITSCPDCGSQDCLYLISANQIKEGYQVQECTVCNKPYVIYLKSELVVHGIGYKCEEIKQSALASSNKDAQSAL